MKKILCVGINLASDSVHKEEFTSKTSLLDWDIILFRPHIGDFFSGYIDYHKGKPSLGDTASFQLKESCEHWRREIKQAVEAEKTVIVFLPPVSEVYIDTGRRERSGTGRNQKTTMIVESYINYKALPIATVPINSKGTGIKLTPSGAGFLTSYWKEFGDKSQYEVLLSQDTKACV